MQLLPTRSAKVALSTHPVNDIQQLIDELKPDKLFLLTDENTRRHCLPILEELKGLNTDSVLAIRAGDAHKGVEALSDVWQFLSRGGATRHSLLINLGGGMPCDLGGFAAATYKRGIPFVNLPTTLLAMVDASVGGKTGINFNGYKNEVGAFKNAEMVLIYTPFLETLDRENLLSGYAEMLKHALIDGLQTLEELLLLKPADLNVETLGALVAGSVLIKDRYVHADPTEKGLRKALNLGHTVGHAFESLAMIENKPLLHGYAVAYGIIPELNLSVMKSGFSQELFQRIKNYVDEVYGAYNFEPESFDKLYELMQHDKKNRDRRINFTLLSEVGKVEVDVDCSKEEIKNSLPPGPPPKEGGTAYLITPPNYNPRELPKDYGKAFAGGHLPISAADGEPAGGSYSPPSESLSRFYGRLGEAVLPPSKSICNRLLILNALSYSPWPVQNLSNSDDTRVLAAALNSNTNLFHVGAAGTSMRFLTAFLARIVGEWTVTGSARMKERPIKVLVDALRELGAKIEYTEKEGYPPLKIFGSALQGKTLQLPGNISSQYISALLMIAPVITDGLTLELTGSITSQPYINLTLKLMEKFGAKSHWKGNVITVPEQSYTPVQVTAEADWSAASYWFEIIALSQPGTSLVIKGLHRQSLQGDAKVAELFQQLGVTHRFKEDEDIEIIQNGERTSCFRYDFADQPDLAQTFAVTCACLGLPFHFSGLHTLTIKETNRIEALIREAAKLGLTFTSNGVDDLHFDGSRKKTGGIPNIDTHHDHRMAMAFAPAALKVGPIVINDPGVVSKSYPGFWDDLREIGWGAAPSGSPEGGEKMVSERLGF